MGAGGRPPVGPEVPGWRPRPLPPRTPLEGRWCRVEPLDPERHAAGLFAAYRQDPAGLGWTYFPYGPFDGQAAFRAWLDQVAAPDDPLFFSILDRDARPAGLAAYMHVAPATGSLEVGHVHFAPSLRRTPAATEAMYLKARRAFEELGYRRYEWKADALNAPSRRAAERLGFTYEGTFRQHIVCKGRNRDTAWFSIVDGEWPAVKRALEAWLEPANFDENGRQRTRLAELR